jgi:hypothetical protein
MEKQDILYGALALVIILVVALVIKPMATGEPIDIGLPTPAPVETPPPDVPVPEYTPVVITTQVIMPPTTIPTPTPRPTWDPGMSSIEFVDPSQYGVSFNQSLPGGTRFDNTPLDTRLTTLGTITGRYSGTSQTIYMPYPYWELWYTVEPSGSLAGKGQSMSTSTVTGPKLSGIKGSGSSQTVMQGSYSVTIPQFSVQVMDGNDPNRIVRTITPPGGIDKDLWSGKTTESEDSDTSITIPDPRPWKERFFEGERNYFFIINAQTLDSYTIEFKVPTRYLENSTAESS